MSNATNNEVGFINETHRDAIVAQCSNGQEIADTLAADPTATLVGELFKWATE